MKRSHLAVGAALAILAAILIWLFVGRGGGNGTHTGSGTGTDRAAVDPKLHGQAQGSGDAPERPRPPASVEPVDPDGTFLLEGQVLGEGDQPVGGALVSLSSQPERTTKSEDDGSFSFDKLLPREYAVSAQAEDSIGGPVVVKVGPDVAPVVVRMREGAALVVRVTAETGAPVPDATVELHEMGSRSDKTDADGKASFRGLGSGFTAIEVRATGFAPASAVTTIGSPGSTREMSVTLRKGAAVAGKVIDEHGAPVADAWLTIQEAASWTEGNDTATSGKDGAFRLEVVAAGSYVITARHGDHAPGTSEIISVDGINPHDGVVVAMKAPGIVRGRVVTSQHQPAPFAAVEVGPKSGDDNRFGWKGGLQRVTADATGAFEVKSLPRTAVRVHAENDEAGSAIVDVDLGATPVVEHLELVLDVDGEIAGIVVDSKGEPIAEAQVSASPDVFKSGGAKKIDDLVFSGFTAATTDGGGAFRLHGLPEGPYSLWASRDGTQQQAYSTKGTQAKTGDKGVRIVLPAPGGIEGKLAFDDGTAPARAVVSISVLPATPVDDGDFSVRDLPPGNYDIHFRGPDFAEVVQRNLEIKAGAITDLGTITVSRGRTIGGRVVDGTGAPVVGARVLAGDILVSQGSGGALDPAIEDQMGLRTAVSGADGAFVILGASPKGGNLIAEDPVRGRSDGMTFARGDTDILGVTLALRGYGSVSGLVTMKGAPVPNAQIMAAAKGGGGHIVMVQTGDDGTYVIDKLPEGDHRLDASRRSGISTSSTGTDIKVAAGVRTTANIDFPVGTISLAVAVKGKNGVKIDAAQMWLFEGTVVAKTAKDIVDHSLAGDPGHVDFWLGVDDVVYKELVAGAYTVCVLPINGDIADQQFQVRLREHLDDLAVVCQAKELAAAPDAQKVTVTSPAMTPLPPD
jgi:protocatechuate 3,4-dioxygenase beta subunit